MHRFFVPQLYNETMTIEGVDARHISKVLRMQPGAQLQIVSDGQRYDMDFESCDEVSMSDYNMMIGLKTAVLLACSAEMGAIIGGAPDPVCKAMYEYGYKLGMAFQVADDYLDAFGDEKVFGKPIGGDILNEKKSWLTVRTLEKIDDKQRFFDAFTMKVEDEEGKAAKIAGVKKLCILRHSHYHGTTQKQTY